MIKKFILILYSSIIIISKTLNSNLNFFNSIENKYPSSNFNSVIVSDSKINISTEIKLGNYENLIFKITPNYK